MKRTIREIVLCMLHSVSLRAIVTRPELDLTVLCGDDELDRPVRWAHVSELADPTPFLVGQELLLTAGVKFPSDVDRYVAGLVMSGVSAIGFGVQPAYDEVPASLIAACRTHRMPLVSVPPETPFLAVSQAVGAELAELQHAELRLLADSQRALTRAAVRPHPVEATLDTLATALDCWTVLLDAEGHALGRSGPALESPVLRDLATRVAAGTGPRSASTEVGADHVVLNPIEQVMAPGDRGWAGGPPEESGVANRRRTARVALRRFGHHIGSSTTPAVLAVGRDRPLSVADRAVIAVALALLGLLHRDTVSWRPARLATRLLLTGETDPLLARVLDAPLAGQYRVLAGHGGPADYELLARLLDTPLIDSSADEFRAVVPADRDLDARLDALREHGWVAAASGATAAGDLAAAELEATELLRRTRATGRRAPDGRETVATLVDPARARLFATRLLAPLATSRAPSPRQLVETLRSWLAQHGNWDRSATVLGIHRNSVRNRVAHAERLLGVDLADVEVRSDMWHAISWLPPQWPDQPRPE